MLPGRADALFHEKKRSVSARAQARGMTTTAEPFFSDGFLKREHKKGPNHLASRRTKGRPRLLSCVAYDATRENAGSILALCLDSETCAHCTRVGFLSSSISSLSCLLPLMIAALSNISAPKDIVLRRDVSLGSVGQCRVQTITDRGREALLSSLVSRQQQQQRVLDMTTSARTQRLNS